MFDLDLGVLTPKASPSTEEAKKLLALFVQVMPRWTPERYGNTEPLQERFDPSNPEAALTAWREPFFWSRSKPRADGQVFMGRSLRHTAMHLRAQFRPVSAEASAIRELLQQASAILAADFAYLHFFSPQELDSPTFQQEMMPFRRGLTTHDLRRGLPKLCWATIFGPPYVRLFGKERLLRVPAAAVKEIADDLVYVQITENLEDLEKDFAGFEQSREAVMDALDSGAFSGNGSHPSAPQFSWVS